MQYTPHHYQEIATAMIVNHPYCALLLDMGLGKTVSTLTAIDLLLDRIEIARVLIVAPKRVAEHTWPDEIRKWDHLQHLRCSVAVGTAAERREALARDADIYVINRENVPWLVEEIGRKPWPFDMVVLDELSSFKSAKAQRFRALRRVRGGMDRVVGLTGTPAPNGLLDLWPQMYLIDQGARLGRTVTGYRERYFTPDKRNRMQIWTWKPKPGAEAEIYAAISDIALSMKAKDLLDLPERTDMDVPVALSAPARQAYDRLERELVLQLPEGTVQASQAATLLNKLLQMAGGSAYGEDGAVVPVHSAKLDALEDLVEQANGRPVLVYYGYRHERDRIMERIPRAEDLDPGRWCAGEQSVALAHPASCGHGLNLQAGGSIMVWYTLPWSLELYEQANARLYRQGQTEPVRIYHLIVSGTVDEQVKAALQRKSIGQDALLEALKAKVRRSES